MKEHDHLALISIIVPVYNVEKYLHRCIDSILAQSYTQIQVILVDDGSTDSSGSICDDYARQDPRILVIHSTNHGLSGARNLGLSKASGDFLIYVDSDDFIGSDHVLNLYATIEGTGALMGVTGSTDVIKGEASREASKPNTFIMFDSSEAICAAIDFSREPFSEHAWGKIFSSKLTPFLIFPEGKHYEDKFTIHRVMFEAGAIAYENANDYYYVIDRDDSITHLQDETLFDWLEAEREIIQFAEENSLPAVEALATRLYYGRIIDFLTHCDKDAQPNLKDALLERITRERTEAIRSPHPALSTKTAMLLSFLPEPLFMSILQLAK